VHGSLYVFDQRASFTLLGRDHIGWQYVWQYAFTKSVNLFHFFKQWSLFWFVKKMVIWFIMLFFWRVWQIDKKGVLCKFPSFLYDDKNFSAKNFSNTLLSSTNTYLKIRALWPRVAVNNFRNQSNFQCVAYLHSLRSSPRIRHVKYPPELPTVNPRPCWPINFSLWRI